MHTKLGYVLALVVFCLPVAVPAQVMPEPKPVVACGQRARQVWNEWIDWFSEKDAHDLREVTYRRDGRSMQMRMDAARCVLLDRKIASLVDLIGTQRPPKVTLNGSAWPVVEVAGERRHWRVQPYAKPQ